MTKLSEAGTIIESPSDTLSMHTDACGHYHLTDDACTYADERGTYHETKADAYRAAARMGYTHVVDRTYHSRDRHRIPARYR